MVMRIQEGYEAFQAQLDEAVRAADSPEQLLALEDVLYDIVEGEIHINAMLNEYMGGERREQA